MIRALVQQVLENAILQGASDIHFEPHERYYHIRFRIDGLLSPAQNPPIELAPQITTRLKIISKLDIAEHRLPQDGRFSIEVNGQTKHCRISTCPTIFGEKLVVRILDAHKMAPNLEKLGLEPQQMQTLLSHLKKPQGMILVTGPTGSGKTLTLYSTLQYIASDTINSITVEDPVEMHLDGINQVQINPKTGLLFSTVLRALLRQDPDIIMVGEIRDLETAQMAIKAAQAGHLVLSTLHTHTASDALARLQNMGVSSFNIINTITLVIAQRLIRCLCVHCQSNNLQGCKDCRCGYRGRTGVFELMPITQAIAQGIENQRGKTVIEHQAIKEGMLSLKESALRKVKNNITDSAEINRVLGTCL